MQDKLLLFKLIRRWQLETRMKNPYICGNAKIDLDDFRDLIRQTFDVIKTTKNEHIFKNTYPEANDVIAYIDLISTVSQYGIDDMTVTDESENCTFTATVLLAEELRLYATRFDYEKVNGEIIYSDDKDNAAGDLMFELSYYVCLEEGEEDKIYTYNVYDGNFDEILEIANRIAKDI